MSMCPTNGHLLNSVKIVLLKQHESGMVLINSFTFLRLHNVN